MTTRSRKPLFERLRQSLTEAMAYSKGELNLKSVELPDEAPEIDAATLTALRKQTAMSQAVFARLLNVSIKTVQSWEQGVREPSDASRRLIHIFSEQPEAVCRVVGLPGVKLEGVKIVPHGPGRRRIVVERAKGRR
jgi:putative transcriptional regulator